MDGHESEQALDRLGAARYVSLTTFRRDGTAVPTPVWIVREGQHLYAVTGVDSGKVKRIRHTARVTLAPCDMRGRVTGAPVDATTRLLDDAETRRVSALIDRKYTIMARVMALLERVRGRGGGRIGLEISL